MKEERAMTTLMNDVPAPPKQIRFVNNQGQPPSKRRRINAACLTCRKRKTRCSGDRPICNTCSRNGHECLGYTEEEKRKDYPATPGVKREPPNQSRNLGLGPPDHDEDYLKEEDDDDDGGSDQRHWDTGSDPQYGVARPQSPLQPRDSARLDQPQNQQLRHRHDHRPAPKLASPNYRWRSVSFHHKDRRGSSTNVRSPMHHADGNKVPYFRYFGPTAIVPGYKQMVVNLSYRDRRISRGGSFSSTSPHAVMTDHRALFATSSKSTESVMVDSTDELPFPCYDPNDPEPTHAMIISLIKTFFIHLGCNYPFLKRDKVLRLVKEKRVEPILVDAMCALATRFAEPLFASRDVRSEYGLHFANRVKGATVDTFPCPTVGAVQAFLLMAYESFGQDQDSALWMYLGLAIRMAVDLGLPKKVGVKYQGEKDPWYTRTWNNRKGSDGGALDGEKGGHGSHDVHGGHSGHGSHGGHGGHGGGSSGEDGRGDEQGDSDDPDTLSPEEQAEVEQERIDTFWAVFVLDRVISSGTGRPVTFKDDDFEFPLPEPAFDPVSGYPDPFPTFIRIIHIYGRVSDVVNNIRNTKDLTPEKLSKLVEMETELTRLYQMQDTRLHFNAVNFQEYVKAGQGTTFILLHFWFHALIIILHQPTLLFGSLSRIHQLLNNSRELSISSAKTIADILSFAELIDPKSFIGNPFTSQPMYIAACAFLMQSGAHSSEPSSPEPSPPDESRPMQPPPGGAEGSSRPSKHSLLALGANQNYQRCYKSLQELQSYWGGVKYILTALDQKSKGIWDCETYTLEEYEMTKRRGSLNGRLPRFEIPASPNAPPIAYSLTGTTNSPNSNLTLLFHPSTNTNIGPSTTSVPPAYSGIGPSLLSNNYISSPPTAAPAVAPAAGASSAPVSAPTPPGNMIYDPIRQSLPDPQSMYSPAAYPQAPMSAARHEDPPGAADKMYRRSISSSKSMKYERHNSDDMVHDLPTPGAESKMHIHAGMAHSGGNSSHNGPHSQHPPPSYTPSSHSSTAYEPSIIPPDASPSSTLADGPSHHHQQMHHSHGSSAAAGGGGGGHGAGGAGGDAGGSGNGGEYTSSSSPFTQTAGLASGSYYPHLPDLTFDSQEIDIGALGIPWLDMPGDVLGLFEPHSFPGSHMG